MGPVKPHKYHLAFVAIFLILAQRIAFWSMLAIGCDVGNGVRDAASQVTKPPALLPLKVMVNLG